MILALDIGNSNIVIGCCEEDRVLFTERISTRHEATELEYAMAIMSILNIYGLDMRDIKGAIISSVVPNLTNIMKDAVGKISGCRVMVVGPGLKTGLKIVMDDPARLGADLVVDAVAGIKEYGAPLIIIDMGTATTISAIGEGGEYLGGVIMPGLEVSLNSLVGGTSQLPRISLEKPKKVIGTNTVDCMKSGIMFGTASNIDGMVRKIRRELGCPGAKAVATGGLSKAVIPLCDEKIIIDDELLLKGLVIIYMKNNG